MVEEEFINISPLSKSINDMSTKERRTLQNRDHVLLEFTRSICPDCREVIDAQVLEKGGMVIMKKRCKKHGLFESLISSDVEKYVNAYKYNKQGLMPAKFGTEIKDGCPYDCGLCPDHQQHSCVGIIEITNACNVQCPTCFATAEGHDFLTLDEVAFMLDNFVKHEGAIPEVIQFSGGEPTIHPHILEMLRLAKEKKVKYVMLNTNGVRISLDEDFVSSLAKFDPVIYLQFDGFRNDTYEKIRGKGDLNEIKISAIEKMEKYGIRVVLVSTIQRGVNEDEIGDLIDFAISNKGIKGIVLQPTFYAGRHPAFDPLDVVTLPDVINGIVHQSKHGFKDTDFVPTPCCYPTCNSSCYLHVDEKGIKPLTRIVDIEEYLDYFANRSVADLAEIKDSIRRLNSFSCCEVSANQKEPLNDNCANDISTEISCCGVPALDLKDIEGNIKLIMIQSFMDPFNFDMKRLMKCCIHEITPDGNIVPICAFNNIPKYRDQVISYYSDRKRVQKKKSRLQAHNPGQI